jgi:hypothetical protein
LPASFLDLRNKSNHHPFPRLIREKLFPKINTLQDHPQASGKSATFSHGDEMAGKYLEGLVFSTNFRLRAKMALIA